MQTPSSGPSRASHVHPLHPFPDGWYFIELGSHLREEQLVEKTWMGREIVVWRDRTGAVCVADAFCPHLGSHLGPSTGGMMRDGNLACPFHGFQYDISGKCVAARDAPPPRSARLKSYEVAEVNGFIFAYWDNAGRPPEWQIPDVSPDGWTRRAAKRLRIRAHPQTTTENSVDLGHLAHVHGYRELKQTEPTKIDGPLSVVLLLVHEKNAHAWTTESGDVDRNRSWGWGLGVSMVEAHGLATSLEARHWIMATPVDGECVDYWLVVDLMGDSDWLGLLPASIRRKVIPKLILNDLVLEVRKDVQIWSRPRYQPRPALSRSDGDIFRFRRYCEQFYGELQAV